MISPSFRYRILGLVLAVATVPLFVIGLWLTHRTARTGEMLLAERLQQNLIEIGDAVAQRWVPYRSSLLDVVERPEVRSALDAEPGGPMPAALDEAVDGLDGAILGLTVYDVRGHERWSFDRRLADGGAAFGAPYSARLPIYDAHGTRLGTLEARVRFLALQPPSAVLPGAVLSAVDPRTGSVLLPVPFDPTLVGRNDFRWNGEDWIGRSREVPEPRITLTAAAPAAPFAVPFEEAARESLLVLLVVATGGLLAAVVLTGRQTASLERLADAARAVTAGDLTRTVNIRRDDEVGAVAEAFDRMVTSLRRMLRQLAERESLEAVNEFAASMAHEIRNPLTSVQLDLQQVEEELPEGSRLKSLQQGAIDELRRLDRTVGVSLDAARSGRVRPRPIDLREPLRRALRSARPHVEGKGAELLEPGSGRPVAIAGDPDALEQLFLNLLLNAAGAVDEGRQVRVTLEEGELSVLVRVVDAGRGIPEADQARIFEPFFTTRPGGTGLGLSVSRRIVTAHAGEIRVASVEGEGTTVEVELPRDPAGGGRPAEVEQIVPPACRDPI